MTALAQLNPTRLFLAGLVFVFLFVLGCAVVRQITGSAPKELPPMHVINTPQLSNDEPPIIKTEDGFEVTSIPGVPNKAAEPLVYKTYKGISVDK